MNPSDSSDDEHNSVGIKSTKLQIADVPEHDEHLAEGEKETEINPIDTPATKKVRKKRTTSPRRKTTRPKTTNPNPNPRPRKRTSPTGLNGNYWNVAVQGERHANTSSTKTSDQSQLSINDDDEEGTTSVSEDEDEKAQEKLQKILSSSPASSTDVQKLYSNRTFITCRSPGDSFFLCQVLQDVFNDTKKIRIRWCSRIDGKEDEDEIDENTHFILDYEDTLDPQTILTGIPSFIRYPDRSISLKKQDILETKRLLEKSIKGEISSPDEPMEVSTESTKKVQSESSDNDDSLVIQPKIIQKRKIQSENTKKQQPPQKRIRKISGDTTPKLKRQVTIDINEITESEKETPKKTVTKPVTTPKNQLFRVQSNRLLKENLLITSYRNDPFFEDNVPVPFISSFVQGKLAIRAVLIDDAELLRNLIADIDHVCSVHIERGLHNDLTAIHYAIKYDKLDLLKILIEDLQSPKKDRCPFPTVSMTKQTTGQSNFRSFGYRSVKIMASRGAKEGNNALNKDNMTPLSIHSSRDLLLYALKNNCSREIYEFLIEKCSNVKHRVYDNIFHILRAGHRKLAASIIGDVKDNTFYGFNNLHHQVLLFDNEDLTINRAASVLKKTKDNFQITPVHCAAINPNSKYLKQLLNIMPEYNILDKYERRPIHFAAACEGPEPLEYLLSKQVNFNDVDRGGNSPLHIAVMNGRTINAEILLRTAKEKAESNEAEDQIVHQKFGLASINRLNKSRFYPLHLAVLNNHLNCVKVLLEYGAQVDIPTSTSSGKLTPLMLACQKGYLNIVIHLIENGAKVEARDRFKRTPLIHACMCGHAHIVSYLLRLGANAQVFDSSSNTALHYAIAYGWYFCVKLLIEAGANVNCVNSWQTTCLAAGFLKGHYGLCDYLLNEHHIDINFKTDDGLTLVMLTVGLEISASSVQQLEYVVNKHKADCTTIDANGNNAFHYLANNTSNQNSTRLSDVDREFLQKNIFQISEILLTHQCNPNQLNNKAQSSLMIALECGNYILVNYLINQAKVDINADISHDGKTLLHYFAMKCNESELILTLMKLPINEEMKKMGQIFDNNGRTPFHYCVEKFNEFCEKNQTAQATDQLRKQYSTIVQMIEHCLDVIGCDPDVEIKSNSTIDEQILNESNDDDDDDEEEKTNVQSMEISSNEDAGIKPKSTSIFFLLRTIPSIDQSLKHPLQIFIEKSKHLNVLHPETRRTPLLQAIYLSEISAVRLLVSQSSCDINLSTSIVSNERQQTPLILACKLQFLSAIEILLNHKHCHLAVEDYQHNQAIHYYLTTKIRSNQYIEILNVFIEKFQSISDINVQGKHGRSSLHIAVYHNSGSLDSITDVEQILIEHGSDLFLKDNLGNIPLHNLFLNKTNGDDPVELCVLLVKAMKSKLKSIDVENHQGYTPLHLAVLKRSIVCVSLLQQNSASLTIENKYSNTIIGTCIQAGHLDLFIHFLQQTSDIDLSKIHTLTSLQTINQSSMKKNHQDIWKWKYLDCQIDNEYEQYSLIYLIIKSDWQGALSLILNDLERYHLTYNQIVESAILNKKFNLVIRLLYRLKDKTLIYTRNSFRQNFFHLLANLNEFDSHIYEQILEFFHEYNLDWNTSDKYGLYPIHYACVQQNFQFIRFLQQKYSANFDLNQVDAFENTAISLLFWKIGSNEKFPREQLHSLIQTNKQLDCLCNYDNEIAMNPLSFGSIESIHKQLSYPLVKFDHTNSNNVRTSPLINAIVYNNFTLAKFLLELGVDVNYSDEEKRTPLMHAVRQNNLHMVKLLLNKDYSLVIEEDQPKQRLKTTSRRKFFLGTTAPAVTSSSQSKTEQFLVTSSIDLNASDSLGRTCIHHLVQPFPDGSYTSNLDLLRLLSQSGAALNKLDLAGLSPLQYGAINGCQHLCDEIARLINETIEPPQATIERFYINDPNKQLLDFSIDFYTDAQDYIEKYQSNHSLTSTKSFYEIDQLSGMKLTGELLFDEELNQPYDVRLIKIDVNYGQFGLYNFYRMQIIKHKSKENLFFLFTRWGRIGDEGQHQLTPYSIFNECRKEFTKIFKEKTGNQWKDIYEFENKPKKYRLIELNEAQLPKYSNVPIDFQSLQSEKHNSISKFQSNIYKNFLKILINPQAIRTNISKTQLDIEWMPISQLKRESLEKGKDIIKKIKNLLVKRQNLTLAMQKSKTIDQQNDMKTILNEIYQLTNEYYTIIPLKGYSDGKLPVLDNENLIKRQEHIIEDLFELELAYKIFLGAQANLKYIAPLDYLYKSMNCQFEAMNKDDIDSQLILRYVWASAENIQVEQIFKVARTNEDERFFKSNIDNHYLLWHGTGICNLISILTRGLLVAPLDATASGSLFGKGIYTADTFMKSLSYCSGVKQTDGEHCFMILCEVALGKMKEVGLPNNDDDDDDDDQTKQLDLNKYQSLKGVGRNIPDPRYTITRNYGVRMPLGKLISNSLLNVYGGLNYNEYIVYDESQVAIRYLVQFRR